MAIREFTCLHNLVSAGYIFEAAVIVRTRYGWVKFMECFKSVYGKRLPLRLIGPLCKRYLMSANLYEGEA